MQAPTGHVVLVFTEVEGAAEIWSGRGGEAAAVIDRHDRLVRERLAARDGFEVKSGSGSFMAAFAATPDAVRFALELQEALADGGPTVRIGIHLGEPLCETDAATGRPDYLGPPVNRAARIMAAAHGGQTLLSLQALEAAGPAVAGAVVHALGEHRLKGLERPEPLFQVLPASQRARRFPPLRTLTALPTNLPSQTTTFVGRERELAELEGPAGGEEPIVALLGPPGIGKTRLAVRLASDLLEKFPGGCWFADLAGARDAAGACAAVALALGAPLAQSGDPAGQVAAILEGRPPLLVLLDTFEHLGADAPAALARWVARAPHARFLVTSRAPVGLAGVREFRLGPLPPADAARLFAERAREARPDFAGTPANAADIAEICAELEGIPLAIELAAARVKIMQPAMMVKKLGQKFQLLKSTRQDAAPRQQTLEGAVEWSFELLEPEERRVFERISVFRGGFTGAAAEAVVGKGSVVAAEALCARSLLEARETRFGRRYSQYRLFREYAERKWGAGGDREEVERRHGAWALSMGEAALAARLGPRPRECIERLGAELENLLSVQDRALERAAPGAAADSATAARELETAARAILAAESALATFGPADAQFPRLERSLRALDARPDAAARVPAPVVTRLLVALAEAARTRGEGALANAAAERAVQNAAAHAGDAEWAEAVRLRASYRGARGEYRDAYRELGESEAAFRRSATPALAANVMNSRGLLLVRQGDPAAALTVYTEAEAFCRQTGYPLGLATVVANKGAAHATLGQFADALACFTQAEEHSGELGSRGGVATNIANRGAVLAQTGDHPGALVCFARAAALYRDLGRRSQLVTLQLHQAASHTALGEPELAVRELTEAESFLRVLDDRVHLAFALEARAAAHDRRGAPPDALRDAADAEEIFRTLADRFGEARLRSFRGRILLRLGRKPGAREALRAAAGWFRDHPAPSVPAFLAFAGLAQAEAAMGDEGEAAQAAVEALKAIEGVAWEHDSAADEVRELLAAMRMLSK
ncbi:MAG: NACHT domain-containing protein [Planctomycetes bacterium]|nr:NACHT domain-containing protein [Planctomycetota bacterium]